MVRIELELKRVKSKGVRGAAAFTIREEGPSDSTEIVEAGCYVNDPTLSTTSIRSRQPDSLNFPRFFCTSMSVIAIGPVPIGRRFKDCKWARTNKSLNQGVFENIKDAAMVEEIAPPG